MLPAGFTARIPHTGSTSSAGSVELVEQRGAWRHRGGTEAGTEPEEDSEEGLEDGSWSARRFMRQARRLAMVALIVCYYWTLSLEDGQRRLLSSAWREILGELHPDSPKDAERLTEGEVVPKWAETLHADDVTKQLNWFQTFCRDKYGMDDHLEFFWQCNIINVEISFDDDSGSRKPLDENMDCSEDFVTRNIKIGNDPRCVPHGPDSLKMLRALERATKAGPDSEIQKVSAIFDEYTVRDGSPLFEPLDESLDELDAKADVLEDLLNTDGQGGDPPSDGADAPSPAAAADHGGDCPPRSAGCAAFAAAGATGEGGGAAVAASPEEPDIPCYCFFNFGENVTGAATVMSTCRNHHWGLIHLCGPTELEVGFSIESIRNRSVEGHLAGLHGEQVALILVEMRFEAIYGEAGSPSGWYRTALNLEEGESFGKKSFAEGCLAAFTLLLLVWFVLLDFLCFLVWSPVRVHQLLALRNPDKARQAADQQGNGDLRAAFQHRVVLLIDGPGWRLSHMSALEVLYENIIGFVSCWGLARSFADSFEKYIPQKQVLPRGVVTTKISSVEYIIGHFTGIKMIVEMLFELFFDETTLHGLAWLLIYFRFAFFKVFVNIVGLKWLPLTIALAAIRLIYFMVFYGLLILGWALIAYLQFGARFMQFSTLSRACVELFFLACGSPAHVFDDIYPFQDVKSLIAYGYLGVFLIAAVVIAMNFFTTILLDAYSIAIDPGRASDVFVEAGYIILEQLAWLLRVPATLAPEGAPSAEPRSSLFGRADRSWEDLDLRKFPPSADPLRPELRLPVSFARQSQAASSSMISSPSFAGSQGKRRRSRAPTFRTRVTELPPAEAGSRIQEPASAGGRASQFSGKGFLCRLDPMDRSSSSSDEDPRSRGSHIEGATARRRSRQGTQRSVQL